MREPEFRTHTEKPGSALHCHPSSREGEAGGSLRLLGLISDLQANKRHATHKYIDDSHQQWMTQAPGRLRLEDRCKFEDSLSCIMISRIA